MDSYSDHPSEYDAVSAAAEPHSDVSMAIGADERRMHVRAYNYWCSLLEGRDFPSIEDLEPGNIEDFGPHSVLLDFTEGRDNPATPYIGTAIREECGIGDDIKSIADVPEPLAAVAPDRPLYADHRQPRAGRLRGRVRQPARPHDLLSRHPDAVQLGRRHDRFHLRRDQLEGRRRGAEIPARSIRAGSAAARAARRRRTRKTRWSWRGRCARADR